MKSDNFTFAAQGKERNIKQIAPFKNKLNFCLINQRLTFASIETQTN